MKSLDQLEAIKYEDRRLEILDQLLLPTQSVYLVISGVEDAWKAINSMQVRGAPAIAIVGCLSLAVEINANEYDTVDLLLNEITNKLNYLKTSRPTAVNMAKEADNIIEYSKTLTGNVEEIKTKLIKKIELMLKEDIQTNTAIGLNGANAILTGDGRINVLTHCNTGSLATAGYGTALGVIRRLHELQKIEMVYCTETRPYLQGSRLTAYELVYEKIPSKLICDSMAAALFSKVKISAVLVGADRVAANGDTANKIGTYQLAVLAKYHNVPFYVCSPLSTIDFSLKSGDEIIIEERPEKEMTDILGKRIAAPGIDCWNPAFDVTPASLISGIVTEKGVFTPDRLTKLKAL